MTRIELKGWNVGLNKVGLTNLLHTDLKLSLSTAKAATDELLDGLVVSVESGIALDNNLIEKIRMMGVRVVGRVEDRLIR